MMNRLQNYHMDAYHLPPTQRPGHLFTDPATLHRIPTREDLKFPGGAPALLHQQDNPEINELRTEYNWIVSCKKES